MSIVQRNYSIPHGSSDFVSNVDVSIPASLVPHKPNLAMESRSKIVSIPSSNGSNQSASGLLFWQIPNNGYYRGQSGYFKMQIQVTVQNTHSAAQNINVYPTGSIASIINRMTIYLASQQAESINNYNRFHRVLLENCVNPSYRNMDAQMAEYAGIGLQAQAVPFAAGANTSTVLFNVAFPVASGILMSERSFPLFLLNSYLQIQFDLASVADSFYCIGATNNNCNVVSYTVQNPQFVYENISCSGEWEARIKQKLLEGHMYNFPIHSTLGLQFAVNAQTVSYIAGVGLSSVDGVVLVQNKAAGPANADNPLISNGLGDTGNTNSNFRLFTDGEQRCQFNLTYDAELEMEKQRCFSSLYDCNIVNSVSNVPSMAASLTGTTVGCQTVVGGAANNSTSLNAINWSLVAPKNNGACRAFSLRKFNESDLDMVGRAVSTLNVIVDGLTTVDSSIQAYLYVLYSAQLKIDMSGAVMLVK